MTTPTFSRHALQRIDEMLLEPHEVRKALLNPQKIHHNADGKDHYLRGRVCLVIDRKSGVCTTVLWRDKDEREKDLARYGPR